MIYVQRTGQLMSDSGVFMARGYSGLNEGKNNPDKQNIHDIGPIPCGHYKIVNMLPGPTEHGPYVLVLQPDPLNEMFGRDGFLCHGDSLEHPGKASKGCIIMPRPIREQMWTDPDHHIQVVSGIVDASDAT